MTYSRPRQVSLIFDEPTERKTEVRSLQLGERRARYLETEKRSRCSPSFVRKISKYTNPVWVNLLEV